MQRADMKKICAVSAITAAIILLVIALEIIVLTPTYLFIIKFRFLFSSAHRRGREIWFKFFHLDISDTDI